MLELMPDNTPIVGRIDDVIDALGNAVARGTGLSIAATENIEEALTIAYCEILTALSLPNAPTNHLVTLAGSIGQLMGQVSTHRRINGALDAKATEAALDLAVIAKVSVESMRSAA